MLAIWFSEGRQILDFCLSMEKCCGGTSRRADRGIQTALILPSHSVLSIALAVSL